MLAAARLRRLDGVHARRDPRPHERDPLASAGAHAPTARTPTPAPPPTAARSPPGRRPLAPVLALLRVPGPGPRDRNRPPRGRLESSNTASTTSDQLLEAVYAQHSRGRALRRERDRASPAQADRLCRNGSHATYFHAARATAPSPTQTTTPTARGRTPALELGRDHATNRAWMTYPDPGRNSQAPSSSPGEQLPPGPRFQPDRWNPETFAANAGPCQTRLHRHRRMRRPRQPQDRHRSHVSLFILVGITSSRRPPHEGRRPNPTKPEPN